jgi:hypothetical protein
MRAWGTGRGESHLGGNGQAPSTTLTRADAPEVLDYGDIQWEFKAFGGATRLTL